MNRYFLIRRLMWPAILLLVGVTALLHQIGVVDHWARLFWPLLLILVGVIKLAERAALAAEGYPMYPGMPGQGYPGQPHPGAPEQAQPPVNETSIVPRTYNQGDGDQGNGGGL